ncbi:hypothetical protein BDW22DRAFT_1350174 [Trametopsis cervina]|nr:hypothetical protein BDW22DRAFT_1350174 [Trametopsis cervina]
MGDDSSSDIGKWDYLLTEQTVIFKRVAARNKALETRLEEAERELSVWKVALKVAEDERNALRKTTSGPERGVTPQEDNGLILCLIDGDRNLFSQGLIQMGQAGGRHAAMLLRKGLADYMTAHHGDTGPTGRKQIWLTIYCNKKELTEKLTNNNVCSTEHIEDFIAGFNQAAPLFSFVDAGVGEGAAQGKIKEFLRVFGRSPQTFRVFFGGGQDNGSILNHLQNEDLNEKLTFLCGDKDMVYECQLLNRPYVEIEGVFMTGKLNHNYQKSISTIAQSTKNGAREAWQVSDEDTGWVKRRGVNDPAAGPAEPAEPKPHKTIPPGMPLHKQKPPPCNFFYLAECKHGANCRYEHNYVLTTDQLDELRKNAKNWPCPILNSGHECYYGDTCPMAHTCPRGPTCYYLKSKKCVFTGKDMHGASADAFEGAGSRSPVASTSASFSPAGSSYW